MRGKTSASPEHAPRCTLMRPGEPPQGRCLATPRTCQHLVLQNLQLINAPARCRALNNAVLESPRGDVRAGFPYTPFQRGAPSPNKVSAAASATHLQPSADPATGQLLSTTGTALGGRATLFALMTQQTASPGVTRLLSSQQD